VSAPEVVRPAGWVRAEGHGGSISKASNAGAAAYGNTADAGTCREAPRAQQKDSGADEACCTSNPGGDGEAADKAGAAAWGRRGRVPVARRCASPGRTSTGASPSAK